MFWPIGSCAGPSISIQKIGPSVDVNGMLDSLAWVDSSLANLQMIENDYEKKNKKIFSPCSHPPHFLV